MWLHKLLIVNNSDYLKISKKMLKYLVLYKRYQRYWYILKYWKFWNLSEKLQTSTMGVPFKTVLSNMCNFVKISIERVSKS